MQIHAATNTAATSNRSTVGSSHRLPQAGVNTKTADKSTESARKSDDKPKDGVEISKEVKDEKKDDKCEKCEDFKDLLEALKDMFSDKDDKKDEKPKGNCSGGGGGGGGGGACNKAGGAAPTEPSQSGGDPISKLKDAVKKVESAQGPDKKKAIQELKDLYEKTKESDVEIPEKLKERIEKALNGSQQTPKVGSASAMAANNKGPIEIPVERPN